MDEKENENVPQTSTARKVAAFAVATAVAVVLTGAVETLVNQLSETIRKKIAPEDQK